MSVYHLVLFQALPAAQSEDLQNIFTNILSLKQDCKKPDGSIYIKSVAGGKARVSEGAPPNMKTHAFVIEFANLEDLEYYNREDVAHTKLLEVVKEKWVGCFEGAEFVDFVDGVGV
ncbi:uncharacterized protein RCC_04791 [Ramularia collo-cygni]|uniref:Stress-response A/B barrel domain-containing protein n=1 Tax=Ramularia collo-cygni TaxID=112498 RepID=A0A2D3V5Y8_9PEZI|nr:uncharacterized protein RCC_04791 [Ramularia collo-cygni]CZT18946.1 uncharacterized protein RCC_04791 [Ramularia collo-cygni]